MSSQTTDLKNVSMRQSNGPKASIPDARPLGELLLALDEFNEYELHTGTGDGVQPLIADGTGTSATSFNYTQENAQNLHGKFVYFDVDSATWKAAYAMAAPASNQHFTAQGFAIALSSTGLKVTTGGKIEIPLKLTDNKGNAVTKGSYYYLCQDEANAGLIQQNAPASGIMQLVCNVVEITDNKTVLLLLNNLNQVANDVIVTDGDGSKYLGDDGQYHNMLVAGLAGRTSNCIETYEVLDIDFKNIAAGAGSYGYVENGDIKVENNVASDFSETNYIISKYLIENYSQYSFKIKQTFGQVQNTEPILCAPNKTNYIAIEQGKLKIVLNGLAYIGNLTYEANTAYYFKLVYNAETGYVISSSTDGTSWTNEIILYDSVNYFNNATVYLGIVSDAENITYTSGSIDLSETGIDYVNNVESTATYPLSAETTKNVATITVTFKGTGLIAAGRARSTSTVNASTETVNTVKNTIIASDAPDIIWDSENGLTTTNYTETNYKRLYDDDSENTTVYAKDTNLCYRQTIIYPNFLETGIDFKEDTADYLINAIQVGTPVIDYKTGNASGFSATSYLTYPTEFNPGNKPWKRQWKVNTGVISTTNDGKVVGSIEAISSGLEWGFSKNKKLILWLGSTILGNDIANGLLGTTVFADNTNLWVEIEFTGTQYIMRSSTNGTTYTDEITVDSTKAIAAAKQCIGLDATIKSVVFSGTVGLADCHDYIDGKLVWTGATTNTTKGDTILGFENSNAYFHPNSFLKVNGFDFNLKLNCTGKLQVERTLDARNYGGTQKFETYYNVQGVDWSTFVNDGNYVQGVKISSQLGTNNTGTGTNSLYQLTNTDAKYWQATSQSNCEPCFAYFNFIKPIRFKTVTFRGQGSANYAPQEFTIDVSNDLNTWYSVLPNTLQGYQANTTMGDLYVPAKAAWTCGINAFQTVLVNMPDDATYWKYVRVGTYQSTAYIPELSGCWIGLGNGSTTDFSLAGTTATELIFEKKDFVNSGTSGINASVELQKVGTAYQVKFLDQVGYTSVAPEDAIEDIEGNKLAPNGESIYADTRLTTELATQRLAYQTRCPVYLKNTKDYGYPRAVNPFQTTSKQNVYYSGCASTGTVANSYHLLQLTDTAGYDFGNANDAASFIITFLCRSRVGHFYIQNHSTVGYNLQTLKVYGSVNGGSFEGTTSLGEGVAAAAIWEEVPITKIIQAFNNGDFEFYAPTEEPNTYCLTGNNSNTAIGTASSGNYGAFNVYIAPSKAYQQYRIEVQRTYANNVIQMHIMPKDVWMDPWATNTDAEGNRWPLQPDILWYPSSTATGIVDKATLQNGILAAPAGTDTVKNLYVGGGNECWNPNQARKYSKLYVSWPYPIDVDSLTLQHGTDLNYAANHFEMYGINKTSDAQAGYNQNWKRITSLRSKSDSPTILNTSTQDASVRLGSREYGYNYFTALFARSLNNNVLLNYCACAERSMESYLANNFNNASKFTEEWKWTNVAGEKDEVRTAACYNHPLLETGETTTLKPAYEVKKKGDDTSYYTETVGEKDTYLPDKTGVYRTTSMIDAKTTPYENRWMYTYETTDKETYYSNTAPTGTSGTVDSYMYKNIIPQYNKEYATGIPMTATANTGSKNGFTYFASSQNADTSAAWYAFQNLAYNVQTWTSKADAYTATTGNPTGEDQYLGFISPTPITVQGYTLGGRADSPSNAPAVWEFQASNDGQVWKTLDSRNTKNSGEENAKDAPVNTVAGTSYYFDNEDAYTQFRWVVKKLVPAGPDGYLRMKIWGLFVLEENPIKVQSIFELAYNEAKAYTNVTGAKDEAIANNATIYTDVNLQNPITNVWAYKVNDGTHDGWTKIAGESQGYVPETTVIYSDPDFTTEYVEALVDTWKYTGEINKKYSYTGVQINNFTIKDSEPYNKYYYTGNVANQFIYTGKIEGWKYTGISEDIYDTVPSFKLTLNRDNARKVTKRTQLGMAYPVANSTDLSKTTYYSFTSGDTAGTIVPAGTPLYTAIDSTESTISADGTNTFVYGSESAQNRYKDESAWSRDTKESDGTYLTAGTKIYSDANLTEELSVDPTQYFYDKGTEASKLKEFYHRITEVYPVHNYNYGVNFDGNKYIFNCYQDGSLSDVQEFTSDETIKTTYENQSVIIMKSQDYVHLNLTKSDYSWWQWNNFVTQQLQERQVNVFRLAKIDGSASQIDDIYKLFPWKIDETPSVETTEIGDPIITLSDKLKSNEIWLEGQELPIKKYTKLYKKYGFTYGGDGVSTFAVPDTRNRALWGSGDGTFGYIEAGLPSISVSSEGAHTHTRGTMEISGGFFASNLGTDRVWGAFSSWSTHRGYTNWNANNGDIANANFYASRNWTGETSSNGVHTHTLSNDAIGKSTTVQPPSIKVRVKTRYK